MEEAGLCLKTVSVKCHTIDCDQSPNEVAHTVHSFPEPDLILTPAHSVNLCSPTWRAFVMFCNIMFSFKNYAYIAAGSHTKPTIALSFRNCAWCFLLFILFLMN